MKYLYIVLVGMLVWACEKDLDTYEGGSGIYFDTDEILTDTLVVSWGMKDESVKTQNLTLNVLLYGKVVDYDRKFSIEVVSETSDTSQALENVDYAPFPLEYVIPANEASAEIIVPLKRRDDLEDRPRRFTVRLIENSELQFLYSRQTSVDSVTTRYVDYQRVIYMDEVFPMPGWWSREGQSRFGDWSQTKASLICDVMGIDREVWLGSVGFGNFTQGYLSYVGKAMYRYLQENPTLDEDGELMEMGPDSVN